MSQLERLDPTLARYLVLLRKACLECSQGNLTGYCGSVSCMIAGMFGGRIIAGKVNGMRHYWNRLPCGTEADLTSCQFGGDGFTPLAKGRATQTPTLTPPHWWMWMADVQRILGEVDVEDAA